MFKKCAASLFTAAALYAASAVPALATSIDFTTLSNGTQVTSQYAGVTFSLAGQHDASGAPTVNFGGLTNSNSGLYPTAQDLVATFSSAITNLSFSFDNQGYNGGNSYAVYGATGNVLASGSLNNSNTFVYDFSALTGITKIVWDNGTIGGSGGNSGDWIQDLTKISFVADPSAVPEPATLALFAIGVIGFAVARRKQAA